VKHRLTMVTRGILRESRIAVPPLKPRPYYHAVDLYERSRAILARRAEAREQRGVRILGYHRVADDRDVLAVSPDAFRRQMQALLESGSRIIRLDAALGLLTQAVSESYVCVTFDDGYRDTLENAAPILRELGIPATVFVPTAMIDGRSSFYWYRRSPPPALTWDDIDELIADGLIDVQSHSRTHPRLPALDDGRAGDELAGSKADIERHVASTVSSFCYPAGLYGPRDARLVLETGYRGAVTCRSGLNAGGGGLVELRRTMVSWRDDVERFRAKVAGRLDNPSVLTEAMQRRRARARPAAPSAGDRK
jgi:peptidoglycan/xylan/chitin deacetylase (PgdA/CDA1 family)